MYGSMYISLITTAQAERVTVNLMQLYSLLIDIATHLDGGPSVNLSAFREPESDADDNSASEHGRCPVHTRSWDGQSQRPAANDESVKVAALNTQGLESYNAKNQSGVRRQKAAILIGRPKRPRDHLRGGSGAP